MRFNQSQNMHLLCFDPLYYPKENGAMRRIRYGGGEEKLKMESGVMYNEDGSATLTLIQPQATRVEVRYRRHNYKLARPEFRHDPQFYAKDYVMEPMTKIDDKTWQITIHPGPGYHSIYFYVDGVKTINTQGPYGYDSDDIRNFIDIPDDPDTQLQNVPHGAISREIYWSATTGRYRACWVYTPASYASGSRSYPVLYLQHGGGQDEVCWFQSGKLDLMLDNLIARGEAEEMIVVCNNGYVLKEIEPGWFVEGRLDEVMIHDCLPHIEKRYRTLTDRHHRAVAGLSMGGGHARRIGLGHPDLFASVGMFSSGECFPIQTEDMDFSALFSDPQRFNEQMDVVLVTCGESDPRYDKTCADLQPLLDRGFHIEFRGYQGQHEWNVWRASAKDFVRKLFR